MNFHLPSLPPFRQRSILLAVSAFITLCSYNACAQACSGTLGDPILNMTFGNGSNPGPAIASLTNYTYVSSGCPGDGYYTLRNSTYTTPTSSTAGCFSNSWHALTSDHTGDGNGYMMIINASYTAGQFYNQTVTGLCGGTTYEFSSWIINLLKSTACTSNASRFPNITFRIETTTGNLIQSFSTGNVPTTGVGNATPAWSRYATFFTTPAGVSSVVLKLINNAPGGCGNDLALDDIQFRACGPSLTISGNAGAGNNPICFGQSVNLTSSITAGYTSPMYQWQQSTDNVTFTDIAGATSASLTNTPPASGTRYYRLLSSESGNIANTKCRIASNVISLVVNALPVAPAVNQMSYCLNASPSQLSATGSGLLWYTAPAGGSGSGTAPTPSASAVGTTAYYVSQIVNGCEGPRSTLNVTINPKPTLVLSASTVGCSIGSAGSLLASVSGGTPGYTYSLNGGAAVSTGAFNNLAAGAYNVVATDTKGCTSSASTTIAAPNPLALSLKAGTNCNLTGNNGLVSAEAGGGTPGYQFDIDGTGYQATSTFNLVTPGAHTISLKDANGCVLSATATVPNVQALAVTVASYSACTPAGQGIINLTASNGTPAYEYQINSGSYQPGSAFSGLSAGSYTLGVRDSRGCLNTTSVTINAKPAPPTVAANPQNFCQAPGTGTLSATGTSLLWYTASTGGAGVSTQSIATGAAGTTPFYVSQTQNGCESDRLPVFATVNPTATLTLATIPPCNAASNGRVLAATTGGSPGFQFAINGGAGQEASEFAGLSAGNYTVTATDAKGCVATGSVTVAAQVNMSLLAAGNAACIVAGQGQINATVSGGSSPWEFKLGEGNYVSNGANATKNYSGINPGTYTLTARDLNGCTAATNVSFNATPVAGASGGCTGTGPNDALIELVAADAGDGAVYAWTGPLGYTASETSITSTFAYTSANQNGTYSLTVTKDGCQATSTVAVQCSAALPVRLVRFAGQQVEKTVVLNWATTEEINASHFELLHSTDARSFESIAHVTATGGTNPVNAYNWIDSNPLSGITYYQLRAVDRDGSSQLSKIVSVHYSTDNKTFVVVNPAEADGRVLVITDVAEPRFSFTDLTGRTLVTSVLDHVDNRIWLYIHKTDAVQVGILRMQSLNGTFSEKVKFK
ncbi:SprB repeat-containing protein [Fibrella sp. HMF5335]|uniref:SprB repeat-containing protein n=1 Tax=Fibrella rubiginis TaxID=2817060 RepID=A0A939K2Z4_9BACT|nr:SprB repeat-containing protein [Fibrella rubiginis]MBO0938707.1 SprB repeat-containing protein [Fibrella rubiginis]